MCALSLSLSLPLSLSLSLSFFLYFLLFWTIYVGEEERDKEKTQKRWCGEMWAKSRYEEGGANKLRKMEWLGWTDSVKELPSSFSCENNIGREAN